MVSFLQIPVQNFSPGAYVEATSSGGGGGPAPRDILLVGTTHGAAPGPLLDPKTITGTSHEWPLDSQIGEMIAATRRTNKLSQITAIAIDDTGTAAAADITVTGPATKAGVVAVILNGKTIQASYDVGATATEIATAIVDAIAATPNSGFTAAAAADVVTVTSKTSGAEGNNHRLDATTATGTGVAVTPTGFGDGAGVVDITTALALVTDERYYSIASGQTDAAAVAALAQEIVRRWGATVEHHGQGFVGVHGTTAEMITEADGPNSLRLTFMMAGASLSPRWQFAAEAAGADAAKADAISGYLGIAMPGLHVPGSADRPDKAARDALLKAGVSTFRATDAGIILDRLVTNRHKDDAGTADTSQLALTAQRGLEALAFSWRALMFNKYVTRGFKLADAPDIIPAPGSKILTPLSLKAEALAWFADWRRQGYVQDEAAFKAQLVAEINGLDENRIDAFLRPRLTKELVTIATALEAA